MLLNDKVAVIYGADSWLGVVRGRLQRFAGAPDGCAEQEEVFHEKTLGVGT
jgi:hypothetical protein